MAATGKKFTSGKLAANHHHWLTSDKLHELTLARENIENEKKQTSKQKQDIQDEKNKKRFREAWLRYQRNQNLRREDLRALLIKAELPKDKAIPHTLPELIVRWLPAEEPEVPHEPPAILNEVIIDDTITSTSTGGGSSFFDVLLEAVDQQSVNFMSL